MEPKAMERELEQLRAWVEKLEADVQWYHEDRQGLIDHFNAMIEEDRNERDALRAKVLALGGTLEGGLL